MDISRIPSHPEFVLPQKQAAKTPFPVRLCMRRQRASRTSIELMFKFKIENRVGDIVISPGLPGNPFTGAMIRELGELMRQAQSAADIVTLTGEGADFTIGRARNEP